MSVIYGDFRPDALDVISGCLCIGGPHDGEFYQWPPSSAMTGYSEYEEHVWAFQPNQTRLFVHCDCENWLQKLIAGYRATNPTEDNQ